MKKFLMTIAIIIATACSTDEQIIKLQGKIGLPQYPYADLYIPEDELGWWYRLNGMGLRSSDDYIITREQITNDTLVNYACWIANKLPENPADYYTGQYDFVVNPVEDGIFNESSNSYDFPGMLSIVTFQNGIPIGEVIKQRFRLIPTDFRTEMDPYSIIIYPDTLMALQAGTADNYTNKAKVRNGLNLVVVEINPDLEITERDYTNNVSTLPLNVTLTTTATQNVLGRAVVDTEAILDNRTRTPDSLVVTKNFRGRDKFVKLDWECPYHEPIYVKHYFTVKKNGVVVAPKLSDSNYIDTISGNYRTATYEITTTVVGLRESFPLSVTVTKN
jgi:hypothetical protein